jgi:hypothetical protein
MPREARPICTWLLCVWGAAAPAGTSAAEYGIVSTGVQQAAGGDGVNVMMGWLGRYDTHVATLAIDHSIVEDSSWTVFRAGATSFRSARLSLSGSMDLGPARIGGDASVYKKVSFEAAFAVGGRWTLKALDTFVDVAPQSGHVLGAAASWRADRALLLHAQATTSISGNLDERNLVLRADYRARPPYLMGGIVVGESNDRLLLLNFPSAASEKELREAFAGVVVPLARFELTVVADAAEIGDFRRRSLTLSFNMPLESTK